MISKDRMTIDMDRLNREARLLREYAETDPIKKLLDYLDALGNTYRNDLVNVSAEDLAHVQAGVRLTESIKSMLTSEHSMNGRS